MEDYSHYIAEAIDERLEREWIEKSYHAAVFVEGPDDIMFWKAVASTLKQAGYLDRDFSDVPVGFLPAGGDLLIHWISSGAVEKLTRVFAVIVDSDRKSSSHNIPGRKLNWKEACKEGGGYFFILRKREIENYLHPDAVSRAGYKSAPYDDFTDMKATFGPNVIKAVQFMTAEDILEMDRYVEEGIEHHELKEIAETLLGLADYRF